VIAKNTKMPFDNSAWGRVKSESLLKLVISSLELLDENETREDDYKDSDLKANLRGNLGSLCWDMTKLFAFFHKWRLGNF
jgi:hypothetical protein